jgi:aspartate/methionine/tyrosine aminotransferase
MAPRDGLGVASVVTPEPLGVAPDELPRRFIHEKVAATPMTGWGGPIADRHVRFVFSNEPVERLGQLRDRVERALARG